MDAEYVGVVENADEDLGSSEILLPTMKKRKYIVRNERNDEESVWSECPNHMIEMMFSSLPVEFSSRFRIVCKEWNTLLSSNRFLSLIPERNPWILFCNETHAIAYCILRQSWKTISLRFLPSRITKSLSQLGRSLFYISGAGLLLFEITEPRRKHMICNPLTSTYKYLPVVIAKNINVGAIMENGESYKIVGLSKKENPSCIQIYHCFEKKWQIEVELPLPKEDFDILSILCPKGFLICTSYDLEFVVWNMEDKRPQLVTFPEANLSILGDRINSWNSQVVVCGSSFLFVVTYLEMDSDDKVVNCEVVVWELEWEKEDRSLWSWKEMTRMPPHMCRQFIKVGYSPKPTKELPIFECSIIGVGNFLCFIGVHGSIKLFIYDLDQRCWSPIRLPQLMRLNRYHAICDFQVKPGMKV
ncbi:hypothetical protein SUGI_1181530 [Cryptomeria japonica]|uniref:F-box/kelch-repeat protein At5g15710-like n=1 Tax=Cryptomeria japonica TaxID=3369 RepID=UPI00241486C6|nr:F-box/kelch-repeat protein At5g15710-like [Cryptomeria japonica]GLJ55045.1 hypothetical protein SUGI_1181530 [Cryptomeria japonica]